MDECVRAERFARLDVVVRDGSPEELTLLDLKGATTDSAECGTACD